MKKRVGQLLLGCRARQVAHRLQGGTANKVKQIRKVLDLHIPFNKSFIYKNNKYYFVNNIFVYYCYVTKFIAVVCYFLYIVQTKN